MFISSNFSTLCKSGQQKSKMLGVFFEKRVKLTKLAARNSKRYIFLLTFFFGEQCKRFYNFTMNGFKIYLQIIRWSSQRRNLIITPSPLFACRNHWLKSPKIYFSCNNLMYCVHQTRIISNVKMQQSIYCGISNYPLCIFSFWIKMTTIYMISTDIGMEITLCNNIEVGKIKWQYRQKHSYSVSTWHCQVSIYGCKPIRRNFQSSHFDVHHMCVFYHRLC